MINRMITLFMLVLLISACQPEGRIFAEHQELSPEFEWLKKDTREFKVDIEDISIDYDFSLSFRYATGYQFKNADVIVTEISPSGKEVATEYSLKIREENGDYIGDPGLDIWDSEHKVETNKKYSEKGTYTYVISHNMINDPMIYAMEIGVILDKSK